VTYSDNSAPQQVYVGEGINYEISALTEGIHFLLRFMTGSDVITEVFAFFYGFLPALRLKFAPDIRARSRHRAVGIATIILHF